MNESNNEQNSGQSLSLKDMLLSKLTMGKLVFLCVVSMALCSVGPLSVFAPVPLAMAFLLFGRAKTGGIVAGFTIILFVVGSNKPEMAQLMQVGTFFVLATIYAVLVSLVVSKRMHPVQGLFRYGIYMLSFMAVLVGLFALTSEGSLHEQLEAYLTTAFDAFKSGEAYKMLVDAGGERAIFIQEAFEKPSEYASEILNWSFSAIFVGIFFGLWITLFMVLRNALIWKEIYDYEYNLSDLVNFKAPEKLVFGLIAGLVLVVGGEYLGETLTVVGVNVLYCLGLFYFFQGFGIYIALLDHLKISGIFRSILIVMTIFMGYQIVTLVGIFDMWIDFRKFLKKKIKN